MKKLSCKKLVAASGPKLALLSVSLIWGTTFPLGKYVLSQVPVFIYLAVRFFMAAGIFLALNRREIGQASRFDWGVSSIVGLMLFAAFAFQTVGLEYTTAAKTSFVTGMYVVFVPFLYFLIFKEPLRWSAVIAGAMAGIGVALLGGDFANLDWDFGVSLVTISGIFTALQIVGVARYAHSISPTIMTFAQLLVVAALCAVIAIFTENWPASIEPAVWGVMLFLAVFATIFAYYIQCRVQQHINHTVTAVILSMECVFGGLLSWMFLDEQFTIYMLVGATMLVIAMIIAQQEQTDEA